METKGLNSFESKNTSGGGVNSSLTIFRASVLGWSSPRTVEVRPNREIAFQVCTCWREGQCTACVARSEIISSNCANSKTPIVRKEWRENRQHLYFIISPPNFDEIKNSPNDICRSLSDAFHVSITYQGGLRISEVAISPKPPHLTFKVTVAGWGFPRAVEVNSNGEIAFQVCTCWREGQCGACVSRVEIITSNCKATNTEIVRKEWREDNQHFYVVTHPPNFSAMKTTPSDVCRILSDSFGVKLTFGGEVNTLNTAESIPNGASSLLPQSDPASSDPIFYKTVEELKNKLRGTPFEKYLSFEQFVITVAALDGSDTSFLQKYDTFYTAEEKDVYRKMGVGGEIARAVERVLTQPINFDAFLYVIFRSCNAYISDLQALKVRSKLREYSLYVD